MKFIKILFIIFISLTSTIKAESNKNLIDELKNGGKIIFIRHAPVSYTHLRAHET